MRRAIFSLLAIVLLGGPLLAGGNQESRAAEPSRGAEQAPVTTPESEPGENPPIGDETRVLLDEAGLRVFNSRVPSIDFTLPRLEGSQTTLSDHQGSVVLLNFWATWCPPCREELPSMVRLQEELGDENFTILAVSLREDRDTVAGFMAEHGFELPVLLDQPGEIGARYGVRGIPTSYVIDASGRVVAMKVGAREWDAPEVIRLMRHLGAE